MLTTPQFPDESTADLLMRALYHAHSAEDTDDYSDADAHLRMAVTALIEVVDRFYARIIALEHKGE